MAKRENDCAKRTKAQATASAAVPPVRRCAGVAKVGDAEDAEMRRFKAWMAKYEPVERAIHAERRKR